MLHQEKSGNPDVQIEFSGENNPSTFLAGPCLDLEKASRKMGAQYYK
jgi:hypoxanthine-guanine phosphoribosyltransferase